jgi:hypothetical protein
MLSRQLHIYMILIPPFPIPILTMTYQADGYSNGLSEEIIGKALQKYSIPRSRVVILSKCYFGVDDSGDQLSIAGFTKHDGPAWVNRIGLSRKHILDAVDASVKRLGTYIDVLQIHRLDRNMPREEIMKALNDVVESGKVRYIGASSVRILIRLCTWEGVSPFIPITRLSNKKSNEELPTDTPSLRNHRWPPGNSKPSKTSPLATAGTNSSRCRIITTCSRARRNGR